MKTSLFIVKLSALCVVIFCIACTQKQSYDSPTGYDLNHPIKYKVPPGLTEISGITFNNGNAATIYAEEDENGRVYFMPLGAASAKFTKFKQTGDFEDIAIVNQHVIMLQSRGSLYTLPLSEVGKPKTDNVQKAKDILPSGEYEGLYGDEANNKVYALCKHCNIDKTSKQTSGYIFDVAPDGGLNQSGTFKINVKHIEDISNDKKVRFHPSALSRSPLTGDWFILSSVNKMLVETDAQFKVKQVYNLNPDIFVQPEGMAFDAQNNLYISNEAQSLRPANILKFTFTKP